MVSTDLLRRYPFFGGLDRDRLATLAKIGHELSVDEGHVFFREDEEMDAFYLTLEGAVAIVIALPQRGASHKIAEQFMRDYETEDILVSTVGSGDVFGWSGIIPPHTATAGAKALTACRVVSFPTKDLLDVIEADCEFGFRLTTKAAQLIRQRLRDVRIETLANEQSS